MNRLGQKCAIASIGLHLLLLVVLVVGPAFVGAKSKPEDNMPILDFIPIKTTDDKVSGGGNPNGPGEWVVIAADRVPVHGGRTVEVTFLGDRAPLPIGPYVMASLFACPVYLMFVLRRGGRNHAYFERFAERVTLPRASRDAALAAYAQNYAERLEHYLRLEPLQWFNYYPFWRG